MILENERFAREMEHVPGQYEETLGLLEGLEGRDLIIAFIESYGISAIEDERYAPVIRPRLESMDAALEEAGIHVVTNSSANFSNGRVNTRLTSLEIKINLIVKRSSSTCHCHRDSCN